MLWETVRMKSASVKKTYNLPPKLVARAKHILGVRTETQAVVRSLEEVVFLDSVDRAVRESAGKLPDFDPIR